MSSYLVDLKKPDWVHCERNDDIYYSMRFENCGFEIEDEKAISRWFHANDIEYEKTNLWWSMKHISCVLTSMNPDVTAKGVLEFRISADAFDKLFKDDDPDEYDDMSEMCDLGFE